MRQLIPETRTAVLRWMRKNHPECCGEAVLALRKVLHWQLDSLADKAQAQPEFADVYFSELADCAEDVLRGPRAKAADPAGGEWVPHSIRCICRCCNEAAKLAYDGKAAESALLRDTAYACECAHCRKAGRQKEYS